MRKWLSSPTSIILSKERLIHDDRNVYEGD